MGSGCQRKEAGTWASRARDLADRGEKLGRGVGFRVNWARGMLLGQEQGKAGLDCWVGLLLGLGFAGFSSFLFFSFSN